ncbi:MAG: ASCH domain-containing protein [Candidatus Diapherotrites archaeon]|nr:ASCH domain-containing protein [Candidatus Diapherotrites archaeon]
MKHLFLTIKKKWFDLIVSGVKKEEYREYKEHWHKRLNKEYDRVCFINGYRKGSPRVTFKLDNIVVGYGKKEWGANDNLCYVIKLGERVS